MSFLDKLKHKADELDLQTKANQLAEQAKVAAQQAKEKAGELAYENRDRIGDLAEKAGHALDDRTGGKYADKIAKAKEQVSRGVDKVAEGRPVHDVPGPEPRTSAPGPVTPPVVADPDLTTPDVTGAAAPGTGPGMDAGPEMETGGTVDGAPGVTGPTGAGGDGSPQGG